MEEMKDKLRIVGEIRNQQGLVRKMIEKNLEYREVKRDEIKFISEKYSLTDNQINSLFAYLRNPSVASGSILNLDRLLVSFLKNLYKFSDEEINSYINDNYWIFKSSYDEVFLRMAIFYHFGLFGEDIREFDLGFLRFGYPREKINAREIYSILAGNNVSDINELREIFNNIFYEDVVLLKRKFPLRNSDIASLKQELLSKIKKEAFKLELVRRKAAKKM